MYNSLLGTYCVPGTDPALYHGIKAGGAHPDQAASDNVGTPSWQCPGVRGLGRRPGAAAAKSLQLRPTLCNPIDGSPPGSPVPGILQARTLTTGKTIALTTWTFVRSDVYAF